MTAGRSTPRTRLDASGARSWCWRAPARTCRGTACAGRTSASPTARATGNAPSGASSTSSTTAARRGASIYRQGLGEFFLDDLWRYEAAFVVLAPEVQARLLPLLRDNDRGGAPRTRRLQHGRLPVAHALPAVEPVGDRDARAGARSRPPRRARRAQAWLRLHGYEPTTLRLSALKRLGARVTSANVAFDDHPNEKRFSDRIETVTVDSVFAGSSAAASAARSR